jgi:aconitate hydratase
VRNPADLERLEKGTVLQLHGLRNWLHSARQDCEIAYGTDGRSAGRIKVRHHLSPRQIDVVLAGGAIPWMRRRTHRQAA